MASQEVYNVGIIGAGLIGRKRGCAARLDSSTNVVAVADIDLGKARELAMELGAARSAADWKVLTGNPEIDVIINATPNYLHAPVTMDALQNGKHVLCEKPLALSTDEARDMVGAARSKGLVLKTGFNHRHYPHLWKAKEMCDEGVLGNLLYIRCHYGHGGRKGYDEEWRGDASLAGGGELMDQGVHVIDLCRWFLGDLEEVHGYARNYFWGGDGLEDNAFFNMSGEGGKLAHAHVSWTQWKNSFSFEVFGEKGYLHATGLAGHYGPPRLKLGVKTEKSVVPEERVFEFGDDDVSFVNEWKVFISAIQKGGRVLADGEDGLEVLKLVSAIYASDKEGRRVSI